MAEVGTKTGSKTQAGRDVYKTPEGEMVSEKSTTFKYKGKWINVPTIHNGYAYDDDILRMMLDAEVIEPTSTHKSKEDAIKSAVERSKSLNFNEGGDVASQTEEALGWAAEGKNLAVDIPEVSFRDAATFVAEMTPIIGDALAAKEVYDELQKDEPNYYLAGALGGAALVGLVPGIGDAAAKAIKKGAKEVFDVAKRVEVDPNAMGSGLGNVRLKPKQDDVAEAESNALGVPKNKPEEFSGTIRLQHGYRGNKPTEFVPQAQYKGDRYDSDGGVFGDKPLYMEDPDNPAFLGDSQVIPFNYDDVVDVDASFDKAFVLTPDTVGSFNKLLKDIDTLDDSTGPQVVDKLEELGYDGLIIRGFPDPTTSPLGKLREEQSKVLRGVGRDFEKGRSITQEYAPKIEELRRAEGINEMFQQPQALAFRPERQEISSFKSADLPPAENAARTQIAGTLPTYKKADTLLTELSGEGKTLDFGAGLGLSKKELGFDTYEPFPKEDFKPDFNDPSEIPSNSYKKITNLNVLNVVPKDVRDTIVKDIGRILEPNGRAIITTRGRDVMAAKGKPGPEPMSIITSKDTYQKGFTQAELKEYLQETLGESFDVVNNKLGAAGVTVHKLPTTGYAEGGEVMKNQMEMAFMKEGGIKDDGMRRDPVSGNEIPPGSMAKEVRDDIPAMLSEGEYVVPADVLRFYGVNFFEDLRSKAKSGLQGMEQNGRIGGEPLSPQQIQQNMGQAPAPVQANQGGMMQGFNQAGLTAPSSTFDPSAFAVVGGSTFNNQGQQAQQDSVTTFKTFINSVDGSTQIVEFVDGNLKNPAMEKFTQPPYYEQGSPALKEAQAQSSNNKDDKPDFPEPAKGEDPKDWGLDVDWSDPMAYANSVIEGQMGRGTRSVLQGLSALAGPIGVAAVGAGLGIQALSQVSNLRAAAELARAQGMDEQAKSIDSMVSKFMAEQPAIVDFFDDLRGESNKNALTVMDRMGLQYSRDPKTGRITYTPQQVKFNEIAAKRAGMDNKAKADSILKDMQNSSGDDDDGGLFPVTAVSIDTDAGGHTTQSMTYGSGDDAVVATADEDGYNKGGLMAPKKKKK